MRRVSAASTIDVLVVGLGPAGSRAACVVACAGLRVLAVDRRIRAGEPVQCAELVPALLNQEIAGLSRFTAQRIDTMETYIEDGVRDVTPHFPGAMIDRAAFDASLAREACDAGADCRYGVALVGVEQDGTARSVHVVRVAPCSRRPPLDGRSSSRPEAQARRCNSRPVPASILLMAIVGKCFSEEA